MENIEGALATTQAFSLIICSKKTVTGHQQQGLLLQSENGALHLSLQSEL